MPRKIKIKSEEVKRLEVLEGENADLWYGNIMLHSKVDTAEREIADLWYQILVGGM